MNKISSPELGGGSEFLKRVCACSLNNGEQSYHNVLLFFVSVTGARTKNEL
jgi:hypothetical protein